jgi:hypothetical protein
MAYTTRLTGIAACANKNTAAYSRRQSNFEHAAPIRTSILWSLTAMILDSLRCLARDEKLMLRYAAQMRPMAYTLYNMLD